MHRLRPSLLSLDSLAEALSLGALGRLNKYEGAMIPSIRRAIRERAPLAGAV